MRAGVWIRAIKERGSANRAAVNCWLAASSTVPNQMGV